MGVLVNFVLTVTWMPISTFDDLPGTAAVHLWSRGAVSAACVSFEETFFKIYPVFIRTE